MRKDGNRFLIGGCLLLLAEGLVEKYAAGSAAAVGVVALSVAAAVSLGAFIYLGLRAPRSR